MCRKEDVKRWKPSGTEGTDQLGSHNSETLGNKITFHDNRKDAPVGPRENGVTENGPIDHKSISDGESTVYQGETPVSSSLDILSYFL